MGSSKYLCRERNPVECFFLDELKYFPRIATRDKLAAVRICCANESAV
jgi:hypothetical protein